ncbi:hypothetical protein CDL15_Pgr002465 [Punica granatum]|uniref:Peptidase A1 domain-containing protein n=1 Tax=Punica granatum TaxID=22663 RepID=A0A218XV65_PUNGR|nr:hypothetical protein CDL15_Pgr002465 [Punica granatum]
MDTGSDLTWTQCKYCTRCFSLQTPLFNPNKSSTYASVSCNSKECRLVPNTECDEVQGWKCAYWIIYGDGSFSRGPVAT